MKTLLIDAGNTRIKWAIVQNTAWVAEGVFEHHALTVQLPQTMQAHPDVNRVIGSNVAGDTLTRQLEMLLYPLGLSPEWLQASDQQAGVRNSYDVPDRLGADRWAALIGARALHGGPCLVVCAGTATTVDTLNGAGVFTGGMILPGETLMQRSLARDTAQLGLAHGQYVHQPRNTADAITSGCRAAQAGAIELAFRPLSADVNARCLISGGAAPGIAPLLRMPITQIDNLVLRGLAVLAEAQTQGRPSC